MKVRVHRLRDVHFPQDEVRPAMSGLWDYEEFLAHPNWAHGWVSFDCLLADAARDVVWCGVTGFDGDIFHAFDRSTATFRSMNFRATGNRYDAKFHRSLAADRRGTIWAATALLHDIDRHADAPGGAIVRFDPVTERLEVVSRPIPHVYIQSITLDSARDLLYGQAYTPELFFRYDLASGETTVLGPLGSGNAMGQGETLAIDRNGTVWGTYAVGRAWLSQPGPFAHRLWYYNPDEGRRVMLKTGLPRFDGAPGWAKSDGAHTGPDGAVYMGTADGLLCRIDPDSHRVEVVCKPAPGRRLAAMVNGPDGRIYGCCGRDGAANLFRYHPGTGHSEFLGPVFDPEAHEQAWQIHHLCICPDGTLYAGENDVPTRSGYLWEIAGVVG